MKEWLVSRVTPDNNNKPEHEAIIAHALVYFCFLSFALRSLSDRVRRGVKAPLEMPVFLHIINSGAGGTVVFPAGEFVSSSLELRDDTVYRLEKGCVLRAAEPTSFAPIGYKRDPSAGGVPPRANVKVSICAAVSSRPIIHSASRKYICTDSKIRVFRVLRVLPATNNSI